MIFNATGHVACHNTLKDERYVVYEGLCV